MRRTASWMAVSMALMGAVVQTQAFTLNYSGQIVSDPWGSGSSQSPIFVVAGVFSSTFDPWRYSDVFGIDDVGNMDRPHLDDAIASGVFTPIGAGRTLSALGQGRFNISATGGGMGGSQVWIFAHTGESPGATFTLFSSDLPSWTVPTDGTGAMTISTAEANRFVFGDKFGNAVALQGLPFPEPSTVATFALGTLVLALSVPVPCLC